MNDVCSDFDALKCICVVLVRKKVYLGLAKY